MSTMYHPSRASIGFAFSTFPPPPNAGFRTAMLETQVSAVQGKPMCIGYHYWVPPFFPPNALLRR